MKGRKWCSVVMVLLSAGASGFGRTPVSKCIVLSSTIVTVASWYASGKGVKIASPLILGIKQALALRTATFALLCLPLLYNFR